MTPRDVAALAATLVGEARGEDVQGAALVRGVIEQRAAHSGRTVAEVCHATAQFSCWNANDPNRALCSAVERAVLSALEAQIALVTAGTRHYCTLDVHPAWAAGRVPVTVHGHHVFYAGVP